VIGTAGTGECHHALLIAVATAARSEPLPVMNEILSGVEHERQPMQCIRGLYSSGPFMPPGTFTGG
jgi:hypothetical protein